MVRTLIYVEYLAYTKNIQMKVIQIINELHVNVSRSHGVWPPVIAWQRPPTLLTLNKIYIEL